MPHPLELPRVWRAVVPLMRAGNAFVGELVAHRLPGFTSVARALDQLAEPAGGLRGIDAVRVGRRSLQMVHFPSCKVRTVHFPLLAFAIRGQQERAFARADQYAYATHRLFSRFRFFRLWPAWQTARRRCRRRWSAHAHSWLADRWRAGRDDAPCA